MVRYTKKCFECGANHPESISILYGYTICNDCESKLALFQDKTIKRHFIAFEKIKEKDPQRLSYEEEIKRRLAFLDKHYIKSKIKLLHIQDRLGNIKQHD